jgi:type IV pilus assembly protein PilX
MFSSINSTMLPNRHSSQRGASLIVVMLILIVVSVLGIGAAQISMMGERSARNDRDMQVAWQGAEAALMDAEFDIRGPNTAAASRVGIFGPDSSQPDRSKFDVTLCGDSFSDKTLGLCDLVDEAAGATIQQKWLQVDFTIDTSSAKTVKYGQYTEREFAAGGTGVQPSKKPRYVIEPIRDYQGQRDKSQAGTAKYMYRVTAMGFGPREDIQAVAQMILRP